MGGREVSRPYRVWFFAEGERFLSTALTTGAKHRHREKAVFSLFVSVTQYFSTEPSFNMCFFLKFVG